MAFYDLRNIFCCSLFLSKLKFKTKLVMKILRSVKFKVLDVFLVMFFLVIQYLIEICFREWYFLTFFFWLSYRYLKRNISVSRYSISRFGWFIFWKMCLSFHLKKNMAYQTGNISLVSFFFTHDGKIRAWCKSRGYGVSPNPFNRVSL